MKNLWTKFTGLSTIWKLIIAAGILIGAVLIYDAAGGGWSALKGWKFDRDYAARMEKVDQLSKDNDALRIERDQARQDALAEKGKRIIYEEKDKNLEAKASAEVAKLDKALEQQAEEEKITAQPVDDLTRCESVKAKMIALGSVTARSINCNEEYKQ